MLEIKNVSVAYGDKKILERVSFSVKPGETVSIVGESGSGKSTLLKAVTGLLAEGVRLCEGAVTFEGMELSSMEPDQLRRLRGTKIATVYQQAGRSMDPVTKIGSQFYEALRTKGRISRSESEKRAIACMERLSLKEPERILHTYPVMLSGGTNQRVAIALAMVMEPSLILADEPTSALDVTVQVEVVETMKKLRENSNASILMVTHNMGVVAQMSDLVGVMYKGRLVEWGGCGPVLSRPLHPYTRLLMDSVLKMDGSVPQTKTRYREEAGVGCPFYARCPAVAKVCGIRMPSMREAPDSRLVMCHDTDRG
ncbi:MAG: ABC transporter ATP-binding protein [Lachnospiraceae bacterium]|nr:ABC transporter ATP-binding protein [Lachnospiraceae bacterium]